MTPEQKHNAKILALQTAKWINRHIQGISIEMVKEEAEIIYQWLIKV